MYYLAYNKKKYQYLQFTIYVSSWMFDYLCHEFWYKVLFNNLMPIISMYSVTCSQCLCDGGSSHKNINNRLLITELQP